MNKIFAIFLCLNFLSINSFASLSSEEKQFPNPGQIYVPGKDTGFAQYAAKSKIFFIIIPERNLNFVNFKNACVTGL